MRSFVVNDDVRRIHTSKRVMSIEALAAVFALCAAVALGAGAAWRPRRQRLQEAEVELLHDAVAGHCPRCGADHPEAGGHGSFVCPECGCGIRIGARRSRSAGRRH